MTKSEYYRGEIYALAGASANHSQIATNLIIALGNVLDKTPCRVFGSDMRLFIEKENHYTYPDVVVVCGKLSTSRNDI